MNEHPPPVKVFAVPKYLPGERVWGLVEDELHVTLGTIIGRVYTRAGRLLYVVEYDEPREDGRRVVHLAHESHLEPAATWSPPD